MGFWYRLSGVVDAALGNQRSLLHTSFLVRRGREVVSGDAAAVEWYIDSGGGSSPGDGAQRK